MAGLRLPGTQERRKPDISPARAAAFRQLARCDHLSRINAPRGALVELVMADGSRRPGAATRPTLDSLVARGLAERFAERGERCCWRLTGYGRELAARVDLSNARRDEALAAELDAAMAKRRAS